MTQACSPAVQEELDKDIKPPQTKVIHFSSGETLTENDSEEEQDRHQLFSIPKAGNGTWKESSWFWGTQILRKSLLICDFLGEKMAGLLGLNAAKYQYAIDQYDRDHKIVTGGDVFSKSTRKNEEKIHLSQIINKPYGATNVQNTTEETAHYKGEQNEGYNCDE